MGPARRSRAGSNAPGERNGRNAAEECRSGLLPNFRRAESPVGINSWRLATSTRPARTTDCPTETTAVARLVGCGGLAAGGECRTAELANPLSGSCPPGRQFGGFAKSLRVRSESREDWDPAMEFGRRGISPLQRRVPHPRTRIRKLLIERDQAGGISASVCRIRQPLCGCASIRSGVFKHHDPKIKWIRSALLDQKLIIS